MLSEEDDVRLLYISEEIGTECMPSINDIKWVVTKLSEINDECSNVWQELQKANEGLARVMEHYEG